MSRTFAIGDIHGCLNALLSLIRFVGVKSDDLLITVGDYVNRGPNSREVVDWLIQGHRSGQVKAIKGNHDIMMLEARNNVEKLTRFLHVGGEATLNSYKPHGASYGRLRDVPEAHWDFFEHQLLPYYETEGHFFVHGNVDPSVPLASQTEQVLLWEKFNDPPLHQSGKTMVCGHTAQKTGVPKFNPNAICIDTRAFNGGWLTCLEPSSRFVWQANQAGETRKFNLDDAERWKP